MNPVIDLLLSFEANRIGAGMCIHRDECVVLLTKIERREALPPGINIRMVLSRTATVLQRIELQRIEENLK